MNTLKKILMAAAVAGPIVLKTVPGTVGTAVGGVLCAIGGLAALFHPAPGGAK